MTATDGATTTDCTFWAHSANPLGQWQPAAAHMAEVARLASDFASAFDAGEEAALAGQLHDLGKYADSFQRRLRGLERGLDHWSPGAWAAAIDFGAFAAALAIQGHHIGLQQFSKDALREMDPRKLAQNHPLGLRLSEVDHRLLLGRLHSDGILTQKPSNLLCPQIRTTASAMLDVRMLYSALVDADFLDTESHLKATDEAGYVYRPAPVSLQPAAALSILSDRVQKLARERRASNSVQQVRNDLFSACRAAGAGKPGLWTLSAPTGSGKTLSMLAFALEHAVANDLRRIIIVIPYLSIIDQTAKVYRALFAPYFGEGYVLEQHSMAQARRETDQPKGADRDAETEGRRREKLLAENWDAPLILTTSVQFLESLFTNRPSAARKLHRVARSVVLFDEVQTLPLRLAVPTLQSLSRLPERFGTSVVFSTATQPAFGHLDAHVREDGNRGWSSREIVEPRLRLFDRTRRTTVHWPNSDQPLSWSELATRIAADKHVLCIVNLKRHAQTLANLLRDDGVEGVCHLSTSMCPAHRGKVLDEIRDLIKPNSENPCRLLATQCVEAGVDLDFPIAYRAFAPLDSIAQAAGRCNRNGRQDSGDVIVFFPEEEAYPPGGYEQAAAVARVLLKELGPAKMDIDDPRLFEAYFRRLYDIAKPEKMRQELREAIELQDFAEVSRLYRVIDTDSVNVLVPYQDEIALFDELCEEVERTGLTGDWVRRARRLTIGLFRPRPDSPVAGRLIPVPVTGRTSSEDWFVYQDRGDYDRTFGLCPPENPGYFAG